MGFVVGSEHRQLPPTEVEFDVDAVGVAAHGVDQRRRETQGRAGVSVHHGGAGVEPGDGTASF